MRAVFASMIIALPIADVISLAAVGRRIGVWPVVSLVLLAGVCGATLIRLQGSALLAQARKAMQEGRTPTREVFDGACVLLGGVLLVIPGFVSDFLGLALLTPAIRSLLRAWLAKSFVRTSDAGWGESDAGRPRASDRPRSAPVIDGEFETVREEERGAEPASEQRPEDPSSVPASGEPQGRADSPWGRKGRVVPSDDP